MFWMEDNSSIFNFKKSNGLTDKIKNNIYVRVLVKLALLFGIVFVADFSIGHLLRYLYFSQQSGNLYRTTYSLEKTKSNLLIFGSSTANHEYSPRIFEDRLHISSYNTGRDGTSIFYQYAILQGVLKRYSPKMILLNFDLEEFKKTPGSYDRLSSLLPYYKAHPEIRSIINMKSPKERIKLCSAIYPFNSMLFTILIGNTEFNKERRKDFQGFVPLEKMLIKESDSGYYPEYELDSNKIKTYRSFIHDCINAKVKLYIVCSPFYNKLEKFPNSILLGQKIAHDNHISFFNFLNDTSFINYPSYFADVNHLNYQGASVFSNKLIDKMINEEDDQSALAK